MIQPPKYLTKRLILKPPTIEDAAAYTKHFVDYDVIRHLSSAVPWPYPENGVEAYLRDKVIPSQGDGRWLWGIYLETRVDELIGAIELWTPGIPENRGFWLGSAHWGMGYMSEAVIPITDFAFEVVSLKKLIFSNALGNLRSRRIKEKTGARLIRIEKASFVDPMYRERELWELTKTNWSYYKTNSESFGTSENKLA